VTVPVAKPTNQSALMPLLKLNLALLSIWVDEVDLSSLDSERYWTSLNKAMLSSKEWMASLTIKSIVEGKKWVSADSTPVGSKSYTFDILSDTSSV
jgi:hypothetical protein